MAKEQEKCPECKDGYRWRETSIAGLLPARQFLGKCSTCGGTGLAKALQSGQAQKPEENPLTPERIQGWQDVIDYLENELVTIDDRTVGSPHFKAMEAINLKTIIYALKEGKDFQLAKAKEQEKCPECRNGYKRVAFGEWPGWTSVLCPTCHGTGKAPTTSQGELREKIAREWYYSYTRHSIAFVEWEKLTPDVISYQRAYGFADQIIPLYSEHSRTIIADRDTEVRRQERERKTAKVICLCGSTRFTDEMLVKQWELTKEGDIVVSWCALPDNYFQGEDKTHIGDQENVKEIVDEVHKRKIDLCDEVFVLNINGYIGESTASEIAYAEQIGRPIKYWQALRQDKEG